MRIAYLAPYQGSTLLARRPIVRNRSLSNKIKIELIATLLRRQSHDLEIISHGEVIEPTRTFYPAFAEPERFHPSIPVYYVSALTVRRLNGYWSAQRMLRLLAARHRAAPFDLVIIFNLRSPHVTCARYAMRRLGLSVVLEYEDDSFVTVAGDAVTGPLSRYKSQRRARLLGAIAGCMAVSPHLLAQVPPRIPQMLLRGVVAEDIAVLGARPAAERPNWILFSGTHVPSNGVAQLIQAWPSVGRPGWELHITGYGEMTDALRAMAASVPGVTFHGLVSRPRLVELLSSAKICVNPHAVSRTPGNVFAFKIIEYLAAGAHVVTTPMGPLEEEAERGVTYMPDNTPATIAATLQHVIDTRSWERRAAGYACDTYGPTHVAREIDTLLRQAAPAGATA